MMKRVSRSLASFAIDGDLLATYAKQKAQRCDDVGGSGAKALPAFSTRRSFAAALPAAALRNRQ
jgi:hypothetical protein